MLFGAPLRANIVLWIVLVDAPLRVKIVLFWCCPPCKNCALDRASWCPPPCKNCALNRAVLVLPSVQKSCSRSCSLVFSFVQKSCSSLWKLLQTMGQTQSLSFYLSISLSIYVSIYLSIYRSTYRSIDLSIYRSIDRSIYLSVCLSIYLSIYLSFFLSSYLSIHLFYLYLSIYLFICKFENEAILRDFLSFWTWQHQKRSNSARLPDFRHFNFQNWSEHGVFWAFWLGNLRRATTACNFSSQLASWLCTRRFSEPTFRPSGATNHWKNTVFRDFPTFSHTWIFFLLRLSLFWSSFFFSSLLFSDSSHLCFSSVHIVGSLTSKLPSKVVTWR